MEDKNGNIMRDFIFSIGNTSDGADVVATNDGIFANDKLVGTYDPNLVINDPHDMVKAIDDAISSSSLNDDDKDELGCYLGAEITISIWWNKNYNN